MPYLQPRTAHRCHPHSKVMHRRKLAFTRRNAVSASIAILGQIPQHKESFFAMSTCCSATSPPLSLASSIRAVGRFAGAPGRETGAGATHPPSTSIAGRLARAHRLKASRLERPQQRVSNLCSPTYPPRRQVFPQVHRLRRRWRCPTWRQSRHQRRHHRRVHCHRPTSARLLQLRAHPSRPTAPCLPAALASRCRQFSIASSPSSSS
mmetsp:Transcript_16864/g.51033  ORF Transcript_16864/g.51033 Transcript_16864/m.51033 type:complete len:207 (-) Transcript_16864:3034-3654(-)|eukprot:scaffold53143_cov23-Tisochrysis_lutea.AAC.7